MKTRRQRKRPGWRQRLRARCALRAALVRLIKVGTRRVVKRTTEFYYSEAFACLAEANRRDAEAIAMSFYASSGMRFETCGQCGEREPETPCGNPCNRCPF